MKKGFWMLILLAISPWFQLVQTKQPGIIPTESGLKARLALVIGNRDYSSPLRSPLNDAKEVAKSLKDLDFEVFYYENLTQALMAQAINAFGQKLTPDSVALFYFAGHGVQVDGVNYLIPVKTEIKAESDVLKQAVSVGRVLDEMEKAKTNTNIIILDACRNNPFRGIGTGADIVIQKPGLAQMNAPGGSIIAYATEPGGVAIEEAEQGLYTGELLKVMREPCLEIEAMFKKVRNQVLEKTKNYPKPQVPWENTSLKGEFRFVNSNCQMPIAQTPECVGQKTNEVLSLAVDKYFEPIGKMGDIDDVKITRLTDSEQFEYTPTGRGPHEWDYKYVDGQINLRPANFGGVIYLAPNSRFGTVCAGYDLRQFRGRLKWEARSLENDVMVEFVSGGINWIWKNGEMATPPFPDSMSKHSLGRKLLTKEWKTFEADLTGLPEAEMSRVVGGLAWVIAADGRTKSYKIEIKNARYEYKPEYVSQQWQNKVSKISWVGYSSPFANPPKGVEPTTEDIRRDLITLRQAGFSGLVTYGATGAMGRELPKIAESLGFEGLIMGIWDPGNQDELKIALSQSNSPIVLGYCVGNEGLKLHDTDEGKRYDWATLLAAMQKLHQTAKKPVTTTEEVEDYLDENLLKAGDWVFPNLHPYFHRILEPNSAVRWTLGGYEDLVRRSRLFVWLKECGLPTAGDGREPLSETAQDQYYAELAKTPAKFVFFEAFDLPWKDHLPVEPHWGIFKSDRTPKILGARLMKNAVPTVAVNSDRIISPTIFSKESFVVYEDFRSENNHFTPSGYMGDVGDVQINESFESNPRSGKTSIQVKYTAKGGGPHQCSYAGPCKWAGVYWQNPANNWGEKEQFKGQGFDLSGFTGLRFWARAEKQAVIEFKVGGISQRFGDSLTFPRSIRVKLTEDWKEYEIKLDGANLKHIIGGFCWSADWNSNPNGAIFYLDDIRFEDERVKR